MEIGCSYRCGSCSLDDDNINISTNDGDEFSGPVALLYRVRDGAINRIRAFSSCTVQASGAKIVWIEGVAPQASIAMLETMAKSDDSMSKKAVFALSLHDGATDALIDLAHHAERSKVRSDALFWLAQTAAQKAAGTLREAVDNDPDAEVRGKAVFAISQLPNDQSIPLLADLMRTHRSREVRKKAAFWLGQKDDPRALSAIENYLRQ
jgi:HEAT repeat protein